MPTPDDVHSQLARERVIDAAYDAHDTSIAEAVDGALQYLRDHPEDARALLGPNATIDAGEPCPDCGSRSPVRHFFHPKEARP